MCGYVWRTYACICIEVCICVFVPVCMCMNENGQMNESARTHLYIVFHVNVFICLCVRVSVCNKAIIMCTHILKRTASNTITLNDSIGGFRIIHTLFLKLAQRHHTSENGIVDRKLAKRNHSKIKVIKSLAFEFCQICKSKLKNVTEYIFF